MTATWKDIFASSPAHVQDIAGVLRTKILAAHPDATEIPYAAYSSVNYGFGPKKNTEGYAYLMAQKDRVNLGFYQGVSLPDPERLLEGTGKTLRHVKVANLQDAEQPAIDALLDAAIDERAAALGVAR